jgi:hypothetical protein
VSFGSIGELPSEVRSRLSEDQQGVFLTAFNIEYGIGKSEGECYREAWAAAVRAGGRKIPQAFLFQPGQWSSVLGSGKITEANVDDAVFAINRRAQLGAPVGVKYDHSDAKRSIPLGIVVNAKLDEEKRAYGDLFIFQDAIADIDGSGPKVLCTKDQIADAILTDGMKLSVEALRNIKDASYYGDRKVSFEPEAMAVLPTGVPPAVVEKVIAGRGSDHEVVVLLAGNHLQMDGEGGKDMSLEELAGIVAQLVEDVKALKAQVGETSPDESEDTGEPEEDQPDEAAAVESAPLLKLKKEVKEYAKRAEDAEAKIKEMEEEQLTSEVETLEESVFSRLGPEEVEKLKEDLKEASLSERKAVFSRMALVISEEPDVPGQRIHAGRRGTSRTVRNSEDKFEEEVARRMKETNESRFAAQRWVLDHMDDNEIETEEVDL